MVYYTSLPLIMHNDALHSASSQNGGCGPSSSPPANSGSPRLQLNLSPSPIKNLSNNSITLQTIDPPSPPPPTSIMQHHQQSLPQTYSNDQINHKILQNSGDLSYVSMHHHQQQQQQQMMGMHQPNVGPSTTKNSNKFKCEQCNMSFGSKSAHTSHMKSHAKQYQTTAQIGSNSSNGIDMTSSRTVNPANGSEYQCDVCKKTFAVPARLVSFCATFDFSTKSIPKYLQIFLLLSNSRFVIIERIPENVPLNVNSVIRCSV